MITLIITASLAGIFLILGMILSLGGNHDVSYFAWFGCMLCILSLFFTYNDMMDILTQLAVGVGLVFTFIMAMDSLIDTGKK